MIEPCPYCDGTGDVHSIDGEWRGECHCDAAKFGAMLAALEAVKAEGMANHNTRCRDWWPQVLAAIAKARAPKEADAVFIRGGTMTFAEAPSPDSFDPVHPVSTPNEIGDEG